MNRKLTILLLALTASVSLYGCNKADVEKHPIILEDTAVDLSSALQETKKESKAATDVETDAEVKGDGILNIEVEGMKETVKGKNHISDLGYQMIYDNERYTLETKDGLDSFTAENPDPELYPYVYLNISKKDNISVSDSVNELENSLSSDYISVEKQENITIGNGYNAVNIRVKKGTDWNSVVRSYYVVENESSVYIIEMQYFLEAAEGHGTRMLAMLDTFIIQ